MTVGDGLKMFGDSLDCPALDERNGWLNNWPDILSEPHEGIFRPFSLLDLSDSGGGLQNKLAHNTPITEK